MDSLAESGGLAESAREIFSGLAGSYERVLDLATFFQDRRWKDWALNALDVADGSLVLDVGCGTLLLEEERRVARFSTVGLDLSKEMLSAGQAKSLLNVVLLVEGDAVTLPFPDAAFDAVVSCYVAKYVNASAFVQELERVVKPGGTVAFYDFARPEPPLEPFLGIYIYGLLRLAGFLFKLARRDEASTFVRLPTIIRRTTWDREVREAMASVGFVDVSMKRFVGGAACAFVARKALAQSWSRLDRPRPQSPSPIWALSSSS